MWYQQSTVIGLSKYLTASIGFPFVVEREQSEVKANLGLPRPPPKKTAYQDLQLHSESNGTEHVTILYMRTVG
jgi:hypothetical protein